MHMKICSWYHNAPIYMRSLRSFTKILFTIGLFSGKSTEHTVSCALNLLRPSSLMLSLASGSRSLLSSSFSFPHTLLFLYCMIHRRRAAVNGYFFLWANKSVCVVLFRSLVCEPELFSLNLFSRDTHSGEKIEVLTTLAWLSPSVLNTFLYVLSCHPVAASLEKFNISSCDGKLNECVYAMYPKV